MVARRNKSGKFSKRGRYQAVKGRLVPIKPVAVKGARPPRAPPFRAAPTRRPTEPKPTDIAPPKGVQITKPSGRAGARFTTWFKAFGTTGSLADMRSAESPDLLGEDLDDFNAPAAFYSNQSGILGQVRFPGIVPLEDLIERLNDALQFAGEGSQAFDFRKAYPRWEYRYQVVESIGPTDRVIAYKKQRR